MSISLKCKSPACGKRFRVREEQSGKTLKCPGCGAAIRVPNSSPSTTDNDSEIDWDAAAQEERQSPSDPAERKQKRVKLSKKMTEHSKSKTAPTREMHPFAFFLAVNSVVSLVAGVMCGIAWNPQIGMIVFGVVMLGPWVLVLMEHEAGELEQGAKNMGGGLIVGLIWGPATFILLPIMSVFGKICGVLAELLFYFYTLVLRPLGIRPSGSLIRNTNAHEADDEHQEAGDALASKLRQSFQTAFSILQSLVWIIVAILFVYGFSGIYYLASRHLQPLSPEQKEAMMRHMREHGR